MNRPPTDLETYRAAVRRAYDLSKAITAEHDLDARYALRGEQRACHDVCVRSPLDAGEKALISSEEFARAYPKLHLAEKRRTHQRSQPWRQVAS